MRYTYSRWRGSGADEFFDPDELIEALSDDLLADGDIWGALQRITRWGLQQESTDRIPGVQDLLQRLRAQRHQELQRYNLESLMEDIAHQIGEIVAAERAGIARRLEEAERADAAGSLSDLMRSIAERKRAVLDALPDGPGPAITSLSDYEFLDDDARASFDALLDTLQQQVLQSHVDSMREMLDSLKGEELQRFKEMAHDLRALLQQRQQGDDPDFARFKQRHGQFLSGAGSLDELMQSMAEQAKAMESLMGSIAPETRHSLQQMMDAVLRDPELRDDLEEVAEAVQHLVPVHRQPSYPFSGEESLTLAEALALMRRMQDLDRLEHVLTLAQDGGDLSAVDADDVRRLMGEEAYGAVERLQHLAEALVDAGYMERSGEGFVLTARGIRRIGQKAVQDIFRHLKRDAFGKHATLRAGRGVDGVDETKAYEFGDPFLLDMNRTVLNAVLRVGQGSPVSLAVRDFEVYRTETLARSSTVLMLDMSRSMPLRGCFVAAKKVAFALNSLIRTQYPRDRLYIVGFSDFARELRPEALHQINWGDYFYGTNMQHGFILARRLLGREKSGNKQIILITDGEPTAHLEGGRVQFSYPPTSRTFQETLREVKRCTEENIVINTFMLERSHYLAEFVNQMTRINHGRAFFAAPERLGDYVLVDYVVNKQKRGVK